MYIAAERNRTAAMQGILEYIFLTVVLFWSILYDSSNHCRYEPGAILFLEQRQLIICVIVSTSMGAILLWEAFEALVF